MRVVSTINFAAQTNSAVELRWWANGTACARAVRRVTGPASLETGGWRAGWAGGLCSSAIVPLRDLNKPLGGCR